jgi:hypothetical protein
MVCPLLADVAAIATSSVSPTLCAVGLVYVLTLVAAWFARMATGSRYEGVCQIACLSLLAATGMLCGVSLHLGPGTAIASAVTLAIATLIAVADVGGANGAGDRAA